MSDLAQRRESDSQCQTRMRIGHREHHGLQTKVDNERTPKYRRSNSRGRESLHTRHQR
jgi:hypothetical protein